MTAQILQFKITLRDITPAVWRRIQVPGNYSFWDLHVAIQDAMGWTDSHLHMFRLQNSEGSKIRMLGLPDPDGEVQIEAGWNVDLAGHFLRAGDLLYYEYDFGDGWEHEILFEGRPDANQKTKYPHCLEGARACPPEDCGGVPGYEDLINATRDPNHERHEELVEWHGGVINPEEFDAESVDFDDPRERLKLVRSGPPF